MKKTKFFFLLLFILISLCTISSSVNSGTFTVFAETTSESEGEEKLNQTILEQLENLDLEALQEYVESLGNFTNESVAERLIAYIGGEGLDYGSMFEQLGTVLFAKIMEILPSFACIAAVTLLSGLISTMKSGSNARTSSEMIFLINASDSVR